MLDKNFSPERQSAFAARFEAQKIAFGLMIAECLHYCGRYSVSGDPLCCIGATGV
jgi:hypothetical protein